MVSAPVLPFRVLPTPLPVRVLASPLPVPLIAEDPVRVRVSMPEPRVNVTELWTLSTPAFHASVTMSPVLSTT
jgi:hypothetical protein